MPSWEQSREDFENLCKMWDKAQKKQIFSDNMNPRNKNYIDPYAEKIPNTQDNEIQTWKDIASNNLGITEDGDGSLLMEDFEQVNASVKRKPKRKNTKNKAEKLANQPNRIPPDTIDSDSVDDLNRVKVTAGLDADPNFDELVKLHGEKYNKEVERNKAYPNDSKKIEKIEKQLENLRKQIAKLSDSAYGTYGNNEYYN